jgi:hypothetical protein
VDRLLVRVRRDADGLVNLFELQKRVLAGLPPSDTNRPPSGLFPMTLGLLSFTNGTVAFRDEALPEAFEARLEPIDFTLAGLTTRQGGGATLALAVAGDGGERISGEGRLGLDPLTASGSVRGDSFSLVRSTPYTDRLSPLRPTNGLLSFVLPFEMKPTEAALDARITGAQLSLTNVAVVERDSGLPFAEAKALGVSGARVSLAEKSARIGAVRAEGLQVHARRTRPSAAAGTAGEPAVPSTNLRGLLDPRLVEALVDRLTDWRLGVDDAAVHEASVLWEDTALETPSRLKADQIAIQLKGLGNQSNAPPMRLSVGARWCEGGTLRIAGEGSLIPARAKLTTDLEGLSLQPLAPYLGQLLDLTLNRGVLSGSLGTEYGGGDADTAPVRSAGRLAIRDLAATEPGAGTNFIRWDTVELNGLDVALEPNRLTLEEVVVRKLQTSLVFLPNGRLNVLQLLRRTRALGEEQLVGRPSAPTVMPSVASVAATTNAPAAAGGQPFWETWPVALGRLRLEEVAVFAADQYYGGGFRTTIESLDGEVRKLALPATEPAEIDLKGRLTATSGFTIAGTLNPDPVRFAADLRLSATRADLRQFTPYSIRFAGYPVARGDLTAEVHYVVEGDALKAENKLLIDQFTLGAKTPSPDAIDLPVKLGVALLKDADGRIQLDVPLTGSLSDPQFSVAPLVWQIIRNMIVKAATAPFKLLGSLFGGGVEEDLEYVEFVPGTAQPVAGQTNRLQTLARALQGRPALDLAILPGFDPVADRLALAANQLEARLRALRAEELAASGAVLPDGAPVALTPEDRARLLQAAYGRDFEGAQTAATPDPAAPAGPPAVGAPATLTPAQMEQRLLETMLVEPVEFQALARRRAEFARTLILANVKIEPERVTIATEPPGEPGADQARVRFQVE